MSIESNLAELRKKIADAAARAGKSPSDITLVAVTKTVDVPTIKEAIDAGVTDIGENYVQDSARKYDSIKCGARWHMIGHLQTNKVKQAVHIFDMIQSVDSLRLAAEIGRRSLEIGKTTKVLVEVNISGEESKTGVTPFEVYSLCEQIAGIEGINLSGLMGIAQFTDDADSVRHSFALLRNLWEKLPEPNRKYLSMGMTSDFEIAVEEGSNMVRIGSAIFGVRTVQYLTK